MRICLLLTFALSASAALGDVVSDCKNKDGHVFQPWHSHQLSVDECWDSKGVPGSCALDTLCLHENKGTVFFEPSCRGASGDIDRKCCRPKGNCTAAPVLSGTNRAGTCMSPAYCSNAAAAKKTSSECGGSMSGLACCVEQAPRSDGVICSDRYSAVMLRLSRVQYRFDQTTITQPRFTNFLPFAMKTFDYLRHPDRCLPLGDCTAATYLAFVYHMLKDITSSSPKGVIDEILEAVPLSTSNKLKNLLADKKYEGYITPEAFGAMMNLMWLEDDELNLKQYGSGTCADWIRMAYAVRGDTHTWKCDVRWFALLAGQYCRPTRKSNLADCASGKGVCHINGNDKDVCSVAGMAGELSASNQECRHLYGMDNAFCCKKIDTKATSMIYDQNEYRNVRVVIDPAVKRDDVELIANIKTAFTKASEMLYEATEHRALFRSVRIILPASWDPSFATDELRTHETTMGAEFYVDPNIARAPGCVSEYDISMNTIQLGYCGLRGLGTHLTPRDIQGKLGAANIVKHFSFNRYGIFGEFPRDELEVKGAPPRCVQDNATSYYIHNGIFDIKVDSTSTATGSLAWLPDYANYTGVEKIVHFCDTRQCNPSRYHNDVIDNTHNRVCNRRGTFDVILENEDFYGAGTPPRHGLDTTPEFEIAHQAYNPDSPTKDDSIERVTLMSSAVSITTQKDNDIKIYLDKGLGKQNLVTAFYDRRIVSSMTGYMIPPGDTSGLNDVPCKDEREYGKMNCEISFKPYEGEWTLRMRPVSTSSTSTNVTVTASATVDRSETDTFSIVGTIVKPAITINLHAPNFWEQQESLLGNTQAFAATISYGRLAILGARVTATITYEDGRSKWKRVLSDDGEAYTHGQGADLYENDGVYSAVLNNFDPKVGRYGVSLEVVAEAGKAYYLPDVFVGIPKSPEYFQQMQTFRVPVTFTRVLSIGMFDIKIKTIAPDYFEEEEDYMIRRKRQAEEEAVMFPRPGRVEKLTLVHSDADKEAAHFTFSFLAVGRNGMTPEELPTYYMLNASTNILNVQGRGEEIEVSPLVDRSLKFAYFARPSKKAYKPGTPITMTISLPLSKWKGQSKIYFSASAYNLDEDLFTAGVYSNIVIAGIP